MYFFVCCVTVTRWRQATGCPLGGDQKQGDTVKHGGGRELSSAVHQPSLPATIYLSFHSLFSQWSMDWMYILQCLLFSTLLSVCCTNMYERKRRCSCTLFSWGVTVFWEMYMLRLLHRLTKSYIRTKLSTLSAKYTFILAWTTAHDEPCGLMKHQAGQ